MKIKPNPFHNQVDVEQITKKDGRTYTVRKNRERYFFPDEWMAFYDSLDSTLGDTYSRQQITFMTLLHTGTRIMEAQNIKVSDIDFERGNVVLRVTKRVVSGRIGQNKVGKSHIRVVSVSSKYIRFVRKVIKEYNLQLHDYLPILDTSSANRAMEKALIKAGIPDWEMFSLHNVRKTSENWLLALGIEWNKVIKQFGHNSTVSLKHYLSSDIFSFDEKRMIAEIMGDIRERLIGGYGMR